MISFIISLAVLFEAPSTASWRPTAWHSEQKQWPFPRIEAFVYIYICMYMYIYIYIYIMIEIVTILITIYSDNGVIATIIIIIIELTRCPLQAGAKL